MHSYTPCTIPSLHVLLAKLSHCLHLCLIRVKRWSNGHMVSFVRKFDFLFWHVCHDVIFPSSYVLLFLIFLLWCSKSQRRTQSFVDACFRVLRSHLNFPLMLVPWRNALLRPSPHFLITALPRTCFQRLVGRSRFLAMLPGLPIFWRKHCPHPLFAPTLSTKKYWIM